MDTLLASLKVPSEFLDTMETLSALILLLSAQLLARQNAQETAWVEENVLTTNVFAIMATLESTAP